MTDNVIRYAKFVEIASIVVFFVLMSCIAGKVLLHTTPILNQVTGTTTNLNTITAQVAKPKYGSLAMLDSTVLDARLTIDHINDVATVSKFYYEKVLPQQTDKINAAMDNTNKLLVTTNTAVSDFAKAEVDTSKQLDDISKHTDTLLTSTTTLVNNTNPFIKQAQQNLVDLDKIETDPEIHASIQNMDATLFNTAGTMSEANQIMYNMNHPHGFLGKMLFKIF